MGYESALSFEADEATNYPTFFIGNNQPAPGAKHDSFKEIVCQVRSSRGGGGGGSDSSSNSGSSSNSSSGSSCGDNGGMMAKLGIFEAIR